MQAVVDRFEDEFAVLEIGDNFKTIPRVLLPQQVREGDVLTLNDNVWEIDRQATRRRKERLKEMTKDLWQD